MPSGSLNVVTRATREAGPDRPQPLPSDSGASWLQQQKRSPAGMSKGESGVFIAVGHRVFTQGAECSWAPQRKPRMEGPFCFSGVTECLL